MKLFNYKSQQVIIWGFFFLFFLIGLFTYKDYGIGIDDKFQRLNGFYWLDYILSFTPFEDLKNITSFKLNQISGPALPSVELHQKYGILFDLPASLLEVLFKIDDSQDYYYFRHFFNFIYFFIGSIFFFKILNQRFKFNVSFFGTCLYILTPRIYGDSFYNMKDIVFMTFLSISIYYCFKFFKNNSYKNILVFSFFTALTLQMRNYAIFLPLAFSFFYFLSVLSKPSDIKFINKYIVYWISTILILFITWPYLWSNPFSNYVEIFSMTDWLLEIKIFFNGKYLTNSYLPYSYISTWILISTPILHLSLFLVGFLFVFKRFFIKFLNVKEKQIFYDFWRGKNEKKDLFILINFTVLFVSLSFLQINYISTWKYLYFINFFIIYIATCGINFLFILFKKRFFIYLNFLLIFSFLFTISRLVVYHPYQGLYFNSIVTNKFKNDFEVDYTSLSVIEALKIILKREPNKKNIKIAAASWTPIERGVELLDLKDRKRFELLGQQFSLADYIYTNNISEVDKTVNNKYKIPSNFDKLYVRKIDGVIVFEIYKRKK